jgi:DNA repair exonuclease SbcCD ATPase subunit
LGTQVVDETLVSDVINRFEADISLGDAIRELILSALLGEVEACLGGKASTKPEPQDVQPAQPVRAYVRSITVEGFRGIGPPVELEISPGPGLTLVVGRNGSGKSSFAEALELLLTGDNQRWSARRSKIWKDGWRNLHRPEKAAIQAGLLIDGTAGPIEVSRSWTKDAKLEQGETNVSGPVGDLGWHEAIQTYRPFLSYNELGSMLEEGPSKLYDALASILGLEEIVQAAGALGDARKTRNDKHKATQKKLDDIRSALEKLDDERGRRCLEALQSDPWKLDVVEQLVAGDEVVGGDDASELALLRELSRLKGPEIDAVAAVAEELRCGVEGVEKVAGTDAEKARRTAEILERALQLHEHHGDGDCPVCGRTGALDEDWHKKAEEEIARLRAEAGAADKAHRELRDAEKKARAFIAEPPPVVANAADVGVETTALQAYWSTWLEVAQASGVELAERLEKSALELIELIGAVRGQAGETLKEKEDAWKPLALLLAEWLPGARQKLAEVDVIENLKSAEQWIRKTGTDIRNERFQPIKEKVKGFWELLRTQSSVDLYDVTFEGKTTSRRVNLNVTVDGTEGAALGVMSQGELHSLALSLFLPRATLESSPFRFIFIDDPVQAMDPAKVDGLARVLDTVAKDRQVVVFTHDDRLPQAVRYLSLDATIIQVQRREGSVVELQTVESPVDHYLYDAMALAKTKELPAAVFQRVVPGLCRQSLEAACLEVIRRRRLGQGESHESVEALLELNRKLIPRLALALFDDADRAREVMRTINNRFGQRAGDVVMNCNKGAHQSLQKDGVGFILDTKKLAKGILELK